MGLASHLATLSFIAVAMNSSDQYEIIWLCKISHCLKQPCSSVCLKKGSKEYQSY